MAKTPQQLAQEAGIKDFTKVQNFITQGLTPEAAIGSALSAQNQVTPTPTPIALAPAPTTPSSPVTTSSTAQTEIDKLISQSV